MEMDTSITLDKAVDITCNLIEWHEFTQLHCLKNGFKRKVLHQAVKRGWKSCTNGDKSLVHIPICRQILNYISMFFYTEVPDEYILFLHYETRQIYLLAIDPTISTTKGYVKQGKVYSTLAVFEHFRSSTNKHAILPLADVSLKVVWIDDSYSQLCHSKNFNIVNDKNNTTSVKINGKNGYIRSPITAKMYDNCKSIKRPMVNKTLSSCARNIFRRFTKSLKFRKERIGTLAANCEFQKSGESSNAKKGGHGIVLGSNISTKCFPYKRCENNIKHSCKKTKQGKSFANFENFLKGRDNVSTYYCLYPKRIGESEYLYEMGSPKWIVQEATSIATERWFRRAINLAHKDGPLKDIPNICRPACISNAESCNNRQVVVYPYRAGDLAALLYYSETRCLREFLKKNSQLLLKFIGEIMNAIEGIHRCTADLTNFDIVKGKTLLQNRIFSEEEQKSMVKQHKNCGLVHADIKLENILFQPIFCNFYNLFNNSKQYQNINFGFVIELTDFDGLTNEGQQMQGNSTPGYASPQMEYAHKNATCYFVRQTDDSWALGEVLFRLCKVLLPKSDQMFKHVYSIFLSNLINELKEPKQSKRLTVIEASAKFHSFCLGIKPTVIREDVYHFKSRMLFFGKSNAADRIGENKKYKRIEYERQGQLCVHQKEPNIFLADNARSFCATNQPRNCCFYRLHNYDSRNYGHEGSSDRKTMNKALSGLLFDQVVSIEEKKKLLCFRNPSSAMSFISSLSKSDYGKNSMEKLNMRRKELQSAQTSQFKTFLTGTCNLKQSSRHVLLKSRSAKKLNDQYNLFEISKNLAFGNRRSRAQLNEAQNRTSQFKILDIGSIDTYCNGYGEDKVLQRSEDCWKSVETALFKSNFTALEMKSLLDGLHNVASSDTTTIGLEDNLSQSINTSYCEAAFGKFSAPLEADCSTGV